MQSRLRRKRLTGIGNKDIWILSPFYFLFPPVQIIFYKLHLLVSFLPTGIREKIKSHLKNKNADCRSWVKKLPWFSDRNKHGIMSPYKWGLTVSVTSESELELESSNQQKCLFHKAEMLCTERTPWSFEPSLYIKELKVLQNFLRYRHFWKVTLVRALPIFRELLQP